MTDLLSLIQQFPDIKSTQHFDLVNIFWIFTDCINKTEYCIRHQHSFFPKKSVSFLNHSETNTHYMQMHVWKTQQQTFKIKISFWREPVLYTCLASNVSSQNPPPSSFSLSWVSIYSQRSENSQIKMLDPLHRGQHYSSYPVKHMLWPPWGQIISCDNYFHTFLYGGLCHCLGDFHYTQADLPLGAYVACY